MLPDAKRNLIKGALAVRKTGNWVWPTLRTSQVRDRVVKPAMTDCRSIQQSSS